MAEDAEKKFGGAVTALLGEHSGKYPNGNSFLVQGGEETILIDPSLSLVGRTQRPCVDRVVNSHCHEDHIAGNHLFPEVPWHLPEADAQGLSSLDQMMEIYGYDEPIGPAFRKSVVEDFHWTARPDASTYRDGDVFDLGGGVSVRTIHTPGHTRGHSCLLVEPDGILYLGDIDLSSFGPYYGDAWSDLEDFERSLALVRGIEARWYATFHHIGVVEGRAAFLEKLDRFAAVIGDRERRLVDYLAEPHTMEEIVAHRFVYRPKDPVWFADPVEKRSMGMHLARLAQGGRVREVEPGRFLRV